MRCDKDGDVLCASETYELRRSPKDLAVRIFIHEGTTQEDAVRLLKKMLEWTEETPEMFEYPKYHYLDNWAITGNASPDPDDLPGVISPEYVIRNPES